MWGLWKCRYLPFVVELFDPESPKRWPQYFESSMSSSKNISFILSKKRKRFKIGIAMHRELTGFEHNISQGKQT